MNMNQSNNGGNEMNQNPKMQGPLEALNALNNLMKKPSISLNKDMGNNNNNTNTNNINN